MLSPLMVEGMKMIVQDAPDTGMGLAIGAALLIGMGLQTGLVPLPIADLWEVVFQRALTAGGVTLVLLMVFAEFNRRQRRSLRTEVSMEALPQIGTFLENLSDDHGWDSRMRTRLNAVAEEVLLVLSETGSDEDSGGARRLLVSASSDGPTVDLEFVSAADDAENLEDRIALVTDPGPEPAGLEPGDIESTGRDVSLRLLRHYSASVTHRQYHDIEVIGVRVASPAAD